MCIVFAHYTGAGYSPFGIHFALSVVGMPLFFVLSGFIIHYVYAEVFAQSWRAAGREFALARFSRLYPLFALLLLTALLFSPLGRALADHPWILLSYATMTGSWWYWHVDGATLIELPFGLSWSVSTEVFFYLAYAAGIWRLAALRRVEVAVAFLIVFCGLSYVAVFYAMDERETWLAWAQAAVPGFIPVDKSFGNSFFRWLVYVSPYFHLLEFIAGVLTCQIFLLMRRDGISLSRAWRELLAWSGTAWLVAGVAAITAVPWVFDHGPRELRHWLGLVNLMSLSFLLAPACCALILAIAAGRSSVGRVLAAPLAVLLGEASYSIYLAHPMLTATAYVTKDNALPLASYPLAIFLLLGFSVALYRAVEVPAKRFLRETFGVHVGRIGTVRPSR